MRPWVLLLPERAVRLEHVFTMAKFSPVSRRINFESTLINEDSGFHLDADDSDQAHNIITGWARLTAFGWPSRKSPLLTLGDLAWIGRENVWPPEGQDDDPEKTLFLPNFGVPIAKDNYLTAVPFGCLRPDTYVDIAAAKNGIEPVTQAEKTAIIDCSGQTEQVLLHLDRNQIAASIEQARMEGYRVGTNDTQGQIAYLKNRLESAQAELRDIKENTMPASIEQARMDGYRNGINDNSGGRIADLERELRMEEKHSSQNLDLL